MKAKNYICTAKGFVKGTSLHEPTKTTLVEYTEKLREAKQFSTKSGLQFLERHGIEGWVWTPYAQDPVRDKYVVKRVRKYGFEYDSEDERRDEIEEWQPVRMFMAHDSDVSFLTSKKLQSDEGMGFEEAKAEALRRNTEMLQELMNKMDNLKTQKEND